MLQSHTRATHARVQAKLREKFRKVHSRFVGGESDLVVCFFVWRRSFNYQAKWQLQLWIRMIELQHYEIKKFQKKTEKTRKTRVFFEAKIPWAHIVLRR
jgi:hypothetical protein